MEDVEREVDDVGEFVESVRPAERSIDDDVLGSVDPEESGSSSRRIPSALTL